MDATTVAVDVAKTVFEAPIANHEWHIVVRRRFNRRQFAHFLATASIRALHLRGETVKRVSLIGRNSGGPL